VARPASAALVLQGGGALGAFEFGAARGLFEQKITPDVIAGVSIGAITAVLLARPVERLGPLGALETFWKKVTVPGFLFPAPLRSYASFFGNPHFFTLRPDFLAWPITGFSWTYFYETQPLRDTLAELVDLERLKRSGAEPVLLLSATNVKKGQIEYFDSSKGGLSLDHVLASGSLPPAFPMTDIGDQSYWDGGLFDNTPLGAVLDRLDPAADVERTVYVVNLFPNQGPIPDSMPAVAERMKNLQFANKTLGDLKLLCRFNEVAELMQALQSLPEDHLIKQHEAYKAVKKRGYIRIPRIVAITPPEPSPDFGDADFSPEAIDKREKQGHAEALKALSAPPEDHAQR
jgi:predicted acylesterase/phospholipase RssA